MNVIAFGLMAGTAFSLAGLGEPNPPRDRSTNKPTAEQCAAAARDGRTLPGCTPDGDSTAAPAEVDEATPPSRFMVCPQDPRCPR